MLIFFRDLAINDHLGFSQRLFPHDFSIVFPTLADTILTLTLTLINLLESILEAERPGVVNEEDVGLPRQGVCREDEPAPAASVAGLDGEEVAAVEPLGGELLEQPPVEGGGDS